MATAGNNSVDIVINLQDNASGDVQKVVVQLEALGPAGKSGGSAAASGIDEISEHSLTALDNVRLLRDDLGIRIPRSMEKAIASSELLSTAIGGIGTGLLAIGALEIGAHIGEGLYEAYEKYVDLNAASEEYFQSVQKLRETDVINVRSIETARDRIKEVTGEFVNFSNIAEAMQSGGVSKLFQGDMTGFAEIIAGRQLAGESTKAGLRANAISPKQIELQHQINDLQIEAAHASDGALQGQAKITAELNKQLDLHKELQQFNGRMQGAQGNKVAPDDGQAQRDAQDAIAKGAAAAQSTALSREQQNQVIQIQNEAINSGLQGDALYASQRQQSIDAVVRKFNEGEISKQTMLAETAAIATKFDNEEMTRNQALYRQIQQQTEQTKAAGLKGVPRIQADYGAEMNKINTDPALAGTPEAAEQERQNAYDSMQQKMLEAHEQFTEQLKALDDRADSYQTEGYGKIEQETAKHVEALTKLYEGYYGQDQATWAGYQNQLTKIQSDADREREQLHQKTMEQIQKEEEQTARLTLPPWQQSMLAIEDSYQDRLRKIQDDVNRHVVSEQEGAAEVTAAWNLEQAQLQKNAEETRDKLASTLSGFFSNPEKFIEKKAMDAAFQLMANEMMQVMQQSNMGSSVLQWLFGMGPQMSTSANPSTALGSIFGQHPAGAGGGVFGGGSQGGGAFSFAQSTTQLTGAGTALTSSASVLTAAGTTLQSAATTLQSVSMGGGFGVGGGGGGGGLSSLFSSGGSSSDGGLSGLGLDTGDMGGDGTLYDSVGGGLAPSVTGSEGLPGIASQSSGGLSSISANSAGSALGAASGIAGGALTAGMGIYNAYENSDPLGGALTGAIGGAEIGTAILPGIGTAIGAGIGAVAGLFAGLFGDKGKGKAQGYDKNTVQPDIASELQQYQMGQIGYNQATQALDSLESQAKAQTNSWGSGARGWYTSHILPEISAAQAQLDADEKGGRDKVVASAAQYHTGGWISHFGSLRTGANEGFIHAMSGEYVMRPHAAAAHAPMLEAMNRGVSFAPGVGRMSPAGGAGSGASFTIQALDSKSVADWMRRGGARQISAGLNQGVSQYAGVGRG